MVFKVHSPENFILQWLREVAMKATAKQQIEYITKIDISTLKLVDVFIMEKKYVAGQRVPP
jgi:hypothetical protein